MTVLCTFFFTGRSAREIQRSGFAAMRAYPRLSDKKAIVEACGPVQTSADAGFYADASHEQHWRDAGAD